MRDARVEGFASRGIKLKIVEMATRCVIVSTGGDARFHASRSFRLLSQVERLLGWKTVGRTVLLLVFELAEGICPSGRRAPANTPLGGNCTCSQADPFCVFRSPRLLVTTINTVQIISVSLSADLCKTIVIWLKVELSNWIPDWKLPHRKNRNEWIIRPSNEGEKTLRSNFVHPLFGLQRRIIDSKSAVDEY